MRRYLKSFMMIKRENLIYLKRIYEQKLHFSRDSNLLLRKSFDREKNICMYVYISQYYDKTLVLKAILIMFSR